MPFSQLDYYTHLDRYPYSYFVNMYVGLFLHGRVYIYNKYRYLVASTYVNRHLGAEKLRHCSGMLIHPALHNSDGLLPPFPRTSRIVEHLQLPTLCHQSCYSHLKFTGMCMFSSEFHEQPNILWQQNCDDVVKKKKR